MKTLLILSLFFNFLFLFSQESFSSSPYNFNTSTNESICMRILSQSFKIKSKQILNESPKQINNFSNWLESSPFKSKIATSLDKKFAHRTMHSVPLGQAPLLPSEHHLAFQFARIIRKLPEVEFYTLAKQ